MVASAAGGAGREDMLTDDVAPLRWGGVSKLKISLSNPAVGLRGCGEGERPNPVLERVGTSIDPLGVVKMRLGSSSWLRGMSTRLLLERVGLLSDMKSFLVGRMKESGKRSGEFRSVCVSRSGGFQVSCHHLLDRLNLPYAA